MSTSTNDVSFTVRTSADLAAADRQVRELLGAQGFGVLTEIDVQETLRSKIGVEISGYKILGACNPHLASRAIAANPKVGALLPCNVVLRETDEGTLVEFADPIAMLGLMDDAELREIAKEARERLTTVAGGLKGASTDVSAE
jgi:uncharacterized protein (DUF302 family)